MRAIELLISYMLLNELMVTAILIRKYQGILTLRQKSVINLIFLKLFIAIRFELSSTNDAISQCFSIDPDGNVTIQVDQLGDEYIRLLGPDHLQGIDNTVFHEAAARRMLKHALLVLPNSKVGNSD